jgi:hypothetical protein
MYALAVLIVVMSNVSIVVMANLMRLLLSRQLYCCTVLHNTHIRESLICTS